MWFVRFILFLLIIIANPSFIIAQYFYCNYQAFDEKDGYQCFLEPQFITQDKKGLLWIGGDNGLYCFDGTHFKNYRHSNADSDRLSANRIDFNYQDKGGDYWVHFFNNGLYNFYPKDGSFKKLDYTNRKEFNIHEYQLKLPFEDKLGRLWFIVPNFGLAQWDAQKRKIIPYKICPPNSCGTYYSTSWVTCAIVDTTNNTFWVGSNDGLIHFFASTGQYVVYRDVASYAINKDNLGNIFNHLFFDAHHCLWAGTWGRGIKKFDQLTNTFEEYKWNSAIVGTQNICSGIGQYDEEHLWVASLDAGLRLLNVKTKQFTTVRQYGNEKMPQDISYLFQTRENVLWILTKKQLLRVSPRENYFTFYPVQFQKTDLYEGSVSAFIKKGNTLYYGSLLSGHFYKYDFAKNKSEVIRLTTGKNYEPIYSLKEDTNGTIWIASRVGTYLFNAATEKIMQPVLNKDDDEVFKYRCYDILHDRDGTHWLATNKGLIHYNPFTKRIRQFSTTSKGKKLRDDLVYTLFQDKKGNIWFGNYWAGLACYSISNDTIYYLNKKNSSPDYNDCISICETKDGKILFVLERLGLGILENPFQKNEKFTVLTSADGLPADYISHVFKDRQQHIWLYTANGICFFDEITKKIITFTAKDGLLQNAVESMPYQDSAGNMYVGFDSSFQTFNPDSLLAKKTFPVSIHLSALWVNNKEWHINEDSISPLKLDYTQSNISFDFAAVSPTLRNDFYYAYKMDGLDKDWTYTADDASGKYTNLPPGNYTLLIKASDHNGNWLKNVFALPIIITPPWYQTWWFYSMIALTVVAVLYTFYRYRINQILQIEKMRARIAGDLHDDIGSALTSISFHSELVKMQLKDEDASLKTTLDKIGNTARNMVNAMSDVVWVINPTNDSAENLILRMKHYAAEMLGERNIQYTFNADEEIEKLKLNMQQRKNLYLIYKEAIHNAVKYAQCSKVEIDFIQTDHQLNLIIKDNGKGFDIQNANDGNGLTNMKRRAEEINADFKINSVIGKGTDINLTCSIF